MFLESLTSGAAKRFLEAFKAKEASTVWIFFDRGDIFHVLEEDARTASECFPKFEHAFRSFTLPDKTELSAFTRKKHQLGKLLQFLLFTKKVKVALVQAGNDGGLDFQGRGSPSDYSELEPFMSEYAVERSSMEDEQVVLAVHAVEAASGHAVGMAAFAKASQTLLLCGFDDNAEFDLFETSLVRFAPMECFVPAASFPAKARKILDAQGVLLSTSAEKVASTPARSVLKQLEPIADLKALDWSVLERDQGAAIKAALLLIPYLKREFVGGGALFDVKTVSLDTHMTVSSTTIEGLNIFGPISLFKCLNHCRTQGGERLLRTWLRQPLKSKAAIQARLDKVDLFFSNVAAKTQLHANNLRRCVDLERMSKKLREKKAGLADLVKVYLGVKEVHQMYACLRAEFGEDNDLAMRLRKSLPKVDNFAKMIEETIDFESYEEDKTYRIKPTFDDNLSELRDQIDKVKDAVKGLLNKEARSLGIDSASLKLESSSVQAGFFFRVTLKDEKLIRAKKTVTVIDSAKSGVKFRTPALERLNAEHNDLERAYEAQQGSVVEELAGVAHGYHAHVRDLGEVVSEIDVYVSFAVAADAAPIPYEKPTLNDDGRIELRRVRHPLVEQLDSMHYIPNDVSLASSGVNFQIITGPNLGGKSTFMRSVALAVYMAQVGSFVPAAPGADICPVDNVLVRIGAGDSLSDGVSTFMAEMLDASRILRNATPRSLILVDELGRGTSTYDGFGLAWGISHYVASKIGAFTLFATHFYEMTKLAGELSNVGNLYCDAVAKDGKFMLLYEVKEGTCDKSYGVDVAKIAGFPESVLKDAEAYLKKYEYNADAIDATLMAKLRSALEDFRGGDGPSDAKRAKLRDSLQVLKA